MGWNYDKNRKVWIDSNTNINWNNEFVKKKNGKLILRKYGIGGKFDDVLQSLRKQLSKEIQEAAPNILEKLRYLNYLSPSVWIGTTARILKGNTSGLHTLMMQGKGITTTAFAQSNPILDFLINFGVDMINPGNIITGAVKPLQLSGKIVNAASKINPGAIARTKSILEHATEGAVLSGIVKTLKKTAGLDKEYDRMLALKYIITGDREALKQLPRGYIGTIDKIRKDYTRGRYSQKPTDLLTLPELNLGVKDSVIDAQDILDELSKVESWLGKPIQIRDGVILGNKNILTNEKIQRLLDGVAVKGVTPVVGITKQQGNTAVKLLNEETPKLVYALDHFDIPGTRASGEAYNTGGMWNFVFKDKNGQYKIVYCDIFKHTDLRNKYIPKALSKMLNSFEKTPSVLLGVDKFSIKHATLHINNELKKRIPKILDAEKAGNIDLKEELIEECIDIIKRDISLFKYDFNECYRLQQSINEGTFYKSIARGLKPMETIKEKIVSKISQNAQISPDDKIKKILSQIFDGPDGANRFIFNTLDENLETKKRWTQTLFDYLYTDKDFFSRDGQFLEQYFPNLTKQSQHMVDRSDITIGFNLDSLKGIKSQKIKGLQEIKRPYQQRTKAKQNTIYCITEYDPNRTDIIDAVLNDQTMFDPSSAFGYEFGVRYRKQYDKIKDGKIDPKELLTEEDLDIFNDRMLIWKEKLAKQSETPEQILFWKLGGIIKILLN